MKSAAIRKRFLDYFAQHKHELVSSSSLVPGNDPTLLFTNAGMVQFKEVFLGQEKRPYVRATSSQRCVRAGGKHNDLDNVGYTARHHTFFEMLGNFSFGDYFKREAIEYAWEFLTVELKLDPEKLWVTVYKDDNEAADIWLKELKIDPDRFSRLGEKDNFWSMGDIGPCGPCSEIFYDHGADVVGGPPGSADEDGDRYVEIWNLVFMQYDRDKKGKLTPLPKPSVDTGMGLERLAAVMQGVHTNYDIDLFKGLIKAAAKLLNVTADDNKALNVIADHIRSVAFLIVDGVFPSNEGRGYVLRRIIRRAVRHGHHLGAKEAFFYKLIPALITQMGDAYPELKLSQKQIEKVIRQEEARFAETLDHGMGILEQDISKLKGKTISGKTLFQLYDTYGFPVDLTADIARERNLEVDMAGFEKEMAGQRDRARAASGFKSEQLAGLDDGREDAEFTGYEKLNDDAKILSIRVGEHWVTEVKQGEEAIVYLDKTPFYAESGGQVGDRGSISVNGNVFSVIDTLKNHAHIGTVEEGILKVGEKVSCEVDQEKRMATACNHSATHLLHAALRKVLGDHVSQKGSLVDEKRLRFDFAHFEPVTVEELNKIEALVNEEIRKKNNVETNVMGYDAAVKAGAMALFGEKYGDEVRVVGMGSFSTELCGGTHVKNTNDIDLLKITSENGVAAGVRRIEACTARGVNTFLASDLSELATKNFQLAEENKNLLSAISDTDAVSANKDLLKENTSSDAVAKSPDLGDLSGAGLLEQYNKSKDELILSIARTTDQNKKLKKELDWLKQKNASSAGDDLVGKAFEVGGIKVLAEVVDGADSKTLRDTLDRLKDKLDKAAIVLAAVNDGKVSLVAGITKNLLGQLHAGEMIKPVAEQVGGKGGGRPDMAQAGGNDPSKLDDALAGVTAWVEQQLAK